VRLEALGALRTLDLIALTGDRLVREIAATRVFVPQPISVDMNGAMETCRAVVGLCARAAAERRVQV
jgi:hypothetical protein